MKEKLEKVFRFIYYGVEFVSNFFAIIIAIGIIF